MTLRVHPDQIVRTSGSPLLSAHESWERVRLGDVADVLNGFAFKSSSFSASEGIPLIRIRDVGRAATAVRYAGDYDERYVVAPGTIVVGMDGDFRAARWVGPPALLNQRVCAIKLRNGSLYDEGFLLYALPGYLDAVNGATSSITVKHLSSETVKAIPLPLPPIAEQRRIVAAIEEHVSRLDAAADSISAASSRLARLADAVMSSLSGEKTTLSEIVLDLRYGTSTKCSTDGAGAPVLRIPNIRRRSIDLGDLKRAIDTTVEIPTVEGGDVLFVRTNGSPDLIGRVGVVGESASGLGFASYLIRARVDRAKADPAFVALALSTHRSREEIRRRAATSAGQYNLSAKAISGLSIPLPALDVQRRVRTEIEDRLAFIEGRAAELSHAKNLAGRLRRSILAAAFRGELVPQDPNDEPASVLLERIAAERAAAPKPARRRRVSAGH